MKNVIKGVALVTICLTLQTYADTASDLLVAAKQDNLAKVQAIIQNTSTRSLKYSINATDTYDMTPLLYAAMNNDFKMVQSLVKAGADVNVISTSNLGVQELVIVHATLYDHITKFSNNTKGPDLGMTPLLYAVKNNNPEMVKLLLSYGADQTMNTKDKYGQYALDYVHYKQMLDNYENSDASDIEDALINAGID